MSIFRRESRASWTGEPIIPPYPGMNLFNGGQSPSVDQALQVSAVWACVRLLADTVSMLPLHAYTFRDGVRVPTDSQPPFVQHPASNASMPDWIYMVMVSALTGGNVIGVKSGIDRQYGVRQINLMDSNRVTISHDDGGKLIYSTRSGGVIPADTVWHMRAYMRPGSDIGLSPIKYASQAINTDAAINSFALGYFNDAPHPASVLTSDQSINNEHAKSIKERLVAAVSGREPLVLGAGLKYQTLSVSPEESQFLATQKLGVAGIARIFGVPPEMIAAEAGNSLTYANMEQKGVDFLTYSIQPWLTRIEAAIEPLMSGKQHVRFDTSVLLRADLETRIKSGAIAIASKQQTPDEVRAWPGNDLPPLTQDQKTWLEVIPLTVSPTGLPKSTLPKGAPMLGADPAATDGNPNA